MKNRTLLLSLFMLAAMLIGTSAWAQTLRVAGVSVNLNATSVQTITGSDITGKVTYNPSSKTLTLEDATIKGSISGTKLGSSDSDRFYIYLRGTNNLETSDRGIRFDDSYVVIYGAPGAGLYIYSRDSNSGYSCISTEGGHLEVWAIKLIMLGASKGFFGTPGSATLSFVNSMVGIACDAGAIYGYKSVYYDDCKCITDGVKYESGTGYVDKSNARVNTLEIEPLLRVGDEPVRTASDSRTGSRYPWKWTKSTKTLEITGNIDLAIYDKGHYSGILNNGIDGLNIAVNEDKSYYIESNSIAVDIRANTNFTGKGSLAVCSTDNSGIVAHADVKICMDSFEAIGEKYGFTDENSGHTLTVEKYNGDCIYQFGLYGEGTNQAAFRVSNLVMNDMDIGNYDVWWNPKDGYAYYGDKILKLENMLEFKSTNQIYYYDLYIANTKVRQDCWHIICPEVTSGSILYDESSKTLTFTDVTMRNTDGWLGNGIDNRGIDGLNIKLVGDNNFTTRNNPICSKQTFSITGNGKLTGTSTQSSGLYLTGENMTCTIDGPQLDFTGASYGIAAYRNGATLNVKGSTTRVAFNPGNSCEAVRNLAGLTLGSGISILEPAGGYFDPSMKSITVNGTSSYKGKVVIGQVVNYGMYIGETSVTSANAADILGNGQFKYDASTKTLTVTNATLTNTEGPLGGGIDNRNIDGLTIKLVGDNIIKARNNPIHSQQSFTITGDGTLTGAATGGYGLYLTGEGMTCTIDGPQVDLSGYCGISDYRGTATLNVKGSTTRLTLNPSRRAVENLAGLTLGSGISILEPAGGYFDPSLKSITINGSSVYMGKVVIGKSISGDLNKDGKVDIADAVSVLDIMAANGYATEADLNKDTKVDIADFVAILDIMASN